ncbi:MAG: tRNA (adenosine(37)-N6)-threonylcarbamoyltransferase complex ATPase subunit type 1 TsaE [Bradymonadaceae bacterium]
MSLDLQRFGLEAGSAMEVGLADEDATRDLGAALGKVLERGDFLGLIGSLGAGKTTLIQGLVGVLQEGMEATSPTYSLLNIYETVPPVYHMDLYRLENIDDLESMGYWDYVAAQDGILCVEWIDRIPDAWPGRGLLLELAHHERRRTARIWATAGLEDKVAGL